MKQRIIILLIVLALAVAVTGCRKSIGDRIAEGLVKDLTGAEVDVSGDGENFTIETEDGALSFGDSMDWPGGSMGDLPKPKAAITGVMDAGKDGCTVMFSEMSKKDADQYLESIKGLGYTENSMDMQDADGIWYVGAKTDGTAVTFTYNDEAGEGMIALTAATEE